MSTKSLVRRYLEDGSITGSQVKMFHKAVRHLYMKAFHYSTTHLPLSNELLKNATLLNFKLRTQCTFSQVEYLVQSIQHRSDAIWNHMSPVRDPDQVLCFEVLSKIAQLTPILPHSNAEEE